MSVRVEQVTVEDEHFIVQVEDVGARIRSIRHRSTDRELLLSTEWNEPPRDVENEWMRRFANGWNVLIPHAGEPYDVEGTAHPFHGEAARRVWNILSNGSGVHAEVELTFVPLRLKRTVRLSKGAVSVEQRIQSLSDQPVRFAWVEHPVLDGSLLGGAHTVSVGSVGIQLVDGAGFAFDSAPALSGWCEVILPDLGGTFRLQWDPEILPNMHVWQERRGTAGHPWFGKVDGVGIEPASHPSGRPPVGLGPLVLQPHGSLHGRISLSITPDTPRLLEVDQKLKPRLFERDPARE